VAKINAEDKALMVKRILEAKRAGISLGTVAEELGISQRTAYNWYNEALRSIPAVDLQAHREEQAARLELLWEKLQPGIAQGSARSIEVGAKVLADARKFLGLDAPAQVEHTVIQKTAAERELEQLLEQAERANYSKQAPKISEAIDTHQD